MFKINNQKYRRAFSLIELSIVILIIGILVAGVTQSSRLVNSYRLIAIRTLTQNSPVITTNNLVAWWEPIMEKSFIEIEASDGAQVSTWIDNSPIWNSNKIDLLQNNPGLRPTYSANGVNGFPSLKFVAGQSMQTASYVPDINGPRFTAFSVTLSYTWYNGHNTILSSRGGGSFAGWVSYSWRAPPGGFYQVLTGAGGGWAANNESTQTIRYNVPEIVTLVYNTNQMMVYQNGVNVSSHINNSFNRNLSSPFGIGTILQGGTNDYGFSGFISEIIIFSRALSNEERIEIDKYLSKKWGIKV